MPVKPKPETPATRGRGPRRQVVGRSATRTFIWSQAISGLGSVKCRLAGIRPCRSASTVLMTEAMPAADSQCPMLLLTEPRCSGWPGSRPGPRTRQAAPTSIGSPSEVPVPCASR